MLITRKLQGKTRKLSELDDTEKMGQLPDQMVVLKQLGRKNTKGKSCDWKKEIGKGFKNQKEREEKWNVLGIVELKWKKKTLREVMRRNQSARERGNGQMNKKIVFDLKLKKSDDKFKISKESALS